MVPITFARKGVAIVAGLALLWSPLACGDDGPTDPNGGNGGDAPTLSGVSPSSGTQGSTVEVTLSGTNFVTGGTTVQVSGSGVTVSNVSVSGATSLTADFAIGASAAAGGREVTVATDEGTSSARTFTVQTAAEASTVEVDDNVFRPSTLTVPEGTTVTWEHVGNIDHTITPDGHSEWTDQNPFEPDSPPFEHTFDEAGTYDYFCRFHSGMTGSIVVEAMGS